jgi:RNA polymerase sigma factor (sigma-70 family)
MKDSYTQQSLPKNSNANTRLNAHQTQLVHSHFYLVDYLANLFLIKHPGLYFLTQSDLVSACDEGLIDAACHYDSERDASFKTYASTCIWNAMLAELQRWHPTHTIVELEFVNGVPTFVKKNDSLFTLVDDAECYSNHSVCCDWEAEEDCLYETLDDVLDRLEQGERDLLYYRHGFNGEPKKLRELAETYHVSQQAVNKRLDKAHDRLRGLLVDECLPYKQCA